MNCKPGDLVIIVKCDNSKLKHHIGSIRTVVEQSTQFQGNWLLSPPTFSKDGLLGSWDDNHLKPIRDNDGEDEILRIAGYPHKETA